MGLELDRTSNARTEKLAYRPPESDQLLKAKLFVLDSLMSLVPGETLNTDELKGGIQQALGSYFCEQDFDMAALVVWADNEGREDLLRE